MAAFTDAVLASSPASSGLEPKIFQLPHRLHMTLGVMSLVSNPETRPAVASSERTVDEALAVLRDLRPEIMRLLDGAGAITVPLRGLAIMIGRKEEALAAYTGPGGAVDDSVMWKVCRAFALLVGLSSVKSIICTPETRILMTCFRVFLVLIQERFKAAGLVTETRPLKVRGPRRTVTFLFPRHH